MQRPCALLQVQTSSGRSTKLCAEGRVYIPYTSGTQEGSSGVSLHVLAQGTYSHWERSCHL